MTINTALSENALADAHVDEAFEVWWPGLKEKLDHLPPEDGTVKAQRPEREILEEILALVRSEAREERPSSGHSPRSPDLTFRLKKSLGRAAKAVDLPV